MFAAIYLVVMPHIRIPNAIRFDDNMTPFDFLHLVLRTVCVMDLTSRSRLGTLWCVPSRGRSDEVRSGRYVLWAMPFYWSFGRRAAQQCADFGTLSIR